MYALNLNCIMGIETARFNEQTLQKLRSEFNDFPILETLQPNVWILKNGNRFILLAPNQIACGKSDHLTAINIDEIKTFFKKIIEVLEIKEKVKLIFTSEIISSPIENSILNKSIEKFNYEKPKNTVGIGYRYIIQNDQLTGEIRVEPFIKEENKVFYALNLESKNTLPVSQFIDLLLEVWSYTESLEELSNELF